MTRCYPSGDAEGAQFVLKSVRRAGHRVQFDAALLRTWLRRLVPQPWVSRLLPPAATTGTVAMLDLWRVTSQGLLLTGSCSPVRASCAATHRGGNSGYGLRRWLLRKPRQPAPTHTVPGSVTVLDLARL